ncbi:hypothetical protein [Micromonospora carbonacea]|uniref:Uncharacterized protein n=1 Tax=Micromonospora carbonacea TaxID=47853 RepID=A0A1C5ARN1_9ACTN|nr:hypothetical protein [Micromonospora carbonacea]SCF47664.1 hypothetical protein GA0070563_116168 [Micromonospora carbonacea]
MTRAHLARTRPPVSGAIVRRVVGTPAEVAATVALVRDSGRLLSMTRPEQLPDGHRVTVTIRFLNPRPIRVRRSRRGLTAAAIATPVVGIVAVAGYLTVQLIRAALTVLPLIAGGVLVLAVIAVLLRRSSGRCCPGLHCPGCHH